MVNVADRISGMQFSRRILKLLLGLVAASVPGNIAAADKLDEVMARGRLLVGVIETSPPFSSRQGERGAQGGSAGTGDRVLR